MDNYLLKQLCIIHSLLLVQRQSLSRFEPTIDVTYCLLLCIIVLHPWIARQFTQHTPQYETIYIFKYNKGKSLVWLNKQETHCSNPHYCNYIHATIEIRSMNLIIQNQINLNSITHIPHYIAKIRITYRQYFMKLKGKDLNSLSVSINSNYRRIKFSLSLCRYYFLLVSWTTIDETW